MSPTSVFPLFAFKMVLRRLFFHPNRCPELWKALPATSWIISLPKDSFTCFNLPIPMHSMAPYTSSRSIIKLIIKSPPNYIDWLLLGKIMLAEKKSAKEK